MSANEPAPFPPTINLTAIAGSDIAMGHAIHAGDDSDGNPVYNINANSIFRVATAIYREDVTPFRFYAGVKVKAVSEDRVRCMGFRDRDGAWMWVIEEVIDWGRGAV